MTTFTGDSGHEWSFDEAERIGDRGGFGIVYRGIASDGQSVAIKAVRLIWGTEGERRLREREVEIGGLLEHASSKHLLVPFDVGRAADDLFIVMPLATTSLRQAIKEDNLNMDERYEAIKQIAAGLVELAELSILHRDLKPGNVLLVDESWKLADFGISRNLAEATGTFTFEGGGTWEYMAPEIWNNQPATAKTDLYALGVVAYETLTGSRPFLGAGEATLKHQHLHEPAPPLKGMPTAVTRLVMRLLAKDPAGRPQDARAVVETLDSALRPLPQAQSLLQAAALEAQQRHALREADNFNAASAKQLANDHARQAVADLQTIFEDAADLAQAALPEPAVQFTWSAPDPWDQFALCRAQLVWNEAIVEVKVWHEIPLKSQYATPFGSEFGLPSADDPVDDDLAAVGALGITYMSDDWEWEKQPDGNLICENEAGRLRWHVLRYEPRQVLPYEIEILRYAGRQGLTREEFARANSGPEHRGEVSSEPLNAETVLKLLQESISKLPY
jgi:hypothetical protein